jgi:hypothetical protein
MPKRAFLYHRKTARLGDLFQIAGCIVLIVVAATGQGKG